jgi:hypothetical protein
MNNFPDNIREVPTRQYGTSLTDTLRRLHRDRSDLYAKVIAKEMSANAAAIEAGFRKKPTPYEQILRLLPKITADDLQRLRERIR